MNRKILLEPRQLNSGGWTLLHLLIQNLILIGQSWNLVVKYFCKMTIIQDNAVLLTVHFLVFQSSFHVHVFYLFVYVETVAEEYVQ